MEVGLIYSSKDPDQVKARNFVRKFITERGILAKFKESDQPVKTPKIFINGQALVDRQKKPRGKNRSGILSLKAIADQLEHQIWCL